MGRKTLNQMGGREKRMLSEHESLGPEHTLKLKQKSENQYWVHIFPKSSSHLSIYTEESLDY